MSDDSKGALAQSALTCDYGRLQKLYCDNFRVMPGQTTLNMSRDGKIQRMRPADAMLLAVAIKFHSSLTNIDLRGYKIGQEGKRAIGRALLGKPNNQLLTCTCNELDTLMGA